MKKNEYSSKTIEEAIDEATKDLNKKEEELIVIEKEEEKGSLFKSKKVTIEVIEKEELIKYIKEYIIELLKNIGIQANIEVLNQDEVPNYVIYSDNDSILIGKNGKNLNSLTIVVKQHILNEIGQDTDFKFNIDINDYKQSNDARLEHLAKSIARDVARTRIAVKMDPMNSYKRRIVHAAIANNKRVTSESEGEEPNRCVVIKPLPRTHQTKED